MRRLSRVNIQLIIAVFAAFVGPAWGQEGTASNPTREVVSGVGSEALGVTTEGFLSRDGEDLYMTACAGCHQPQGQGAVGAGQYPPLAGNARLEFGRYPAWIIVNGLGAMRSFGPWLDDEQVVEVVAYLQQNMGNRYEVDIEPQDVTELRDAATFD
ncbi:hypothetical protein A8B78_12000 [Jannaschia sp. EhC01]|nr:hypothetical protein A8B78_12000 [Jannaschia sp. EhC01]